jgi:hypothetical protein
MNIDLILLVFSFVLFVIAASGRVASKYNLIAAGLAFYILSLLIP